MERFKNSSNKTKLQYLLSGLGLGAVAFFSYWFYKSVLKRRINSYAGYASNKSRITTLTYEAAKSRSSRIKDLHYTLFLQLKVDSVINMKNIYEGAVRIEFAYTAIDSNDVVIDYIGDISNLTVNGVKADIVHQNGKLSINSNNLLKNAKNVVNIKFSNHYDNDTKGIRLFIDPEDNVKI